MKTLKLLFLLLTSCLLWQYSQAQPCATFSTSQLGAGDSVLLYPALAINEDSTGSTITWDFGDGQTTVANGPVQHNYAGPGEYIICLNYVSPACTSTVCDTIKICADAYGDMQVQQAVSGNTIDFGVSNVPIGSTYQWEFGSASFPSSTSASPQVTFPFNSYYNGHVRIITPMGCTLYRTFIVDLRNECQAQFSYNAYGNDVNFSGFYNSGSPVYTWNFGDGSTATGQTPGHTYAAFGTYDICLIVTNTNCVDTLFQSITTTQPFCPGIDTLFNSHLIASGSLLLQPINIPQVPGITLTVDFGDGTTLTYDTIQSIQHAYTDAGMYNLCISYTNAYCNVNSCDSVYIDPCPATGVQYEIINDSTLLFTLTAQLNGWTYNWNFSNGIADNLTNDSVFVTVNNGGSFSGTVDITAPGCGGPGSVPFTYSVSDSGLCYLSFTTTPGGGNSILFNSIGLNGQAGTSYSFDYGDGHTGDIPAHTYANAGTYTVCLTRTSLACSSTVCKPVTTGSGLAIYRGRIFKGGNLACRGVAYLIHEDSTGHLAAIDSFVFGSPDTCAGYYLFNITPGNYYVKAALTPDDADYANYLPTYYGDVLNWTDATILPSPFDHHDINLIAGTNPGGPGFIGGYVSEGAGLGVINGNGEERSVGDPIANVQINLLTENNVPVAYAYTDGSGRYTFSNLALGTYKVYAEALSKTPIAQSVILTVNNSSQDNVDVLINSNSAVTDINDIADLKVDAIFPNPVKDKATIRFTAKQNATATVQVTDMLGNVISRNTTNIIAGNNDVTVDLQNKASGVYHVSITNSTNKKIVKLIKAN